MAVLPVNSYSYYVKQTFLLARFVHTHSYRFQLLSKFATSTVRALNRDYIYTCTKRFSSTPILRGETFLVGFLVKMKATAVHLNSWKWKFGSRVFMYLNFRVSVVTQQMSNFSFLCTYFLLILRCERVGNRNPSKFTQGLSLLKSKNIFFWFLIIDLPQNSEFFRETRRTSEALKFSVLVASYRVKLG